VNVANKQKLNIRRDTIKSQELFTGVSASRRQGQTISAPDRCRRQSG